MDDLIKQLLQNQQAFMAKQEETTRLFANQISDLNKRLNDRPSGSGTTSLPSNTIANPRGEIKAITTRSGALYEPTAPTTSSSPPPKVVDRETEVTKDPVPPTNNGGSENVQPPVVQVSKDKGKVVFENNVKYKSK